VRHGADRVRTGIGDTAVRDGVDVHTLGYFMDVESPAPGQFPRLEREDGYPSRAMVDLLRGFGIISTQRDS